MTVDAGMNESRHNERIADAPRVGRAVRETSRMRLWVMSHVW